MLSIRPTLQLKLTAAILAMLAVSALGIGLATNRTANRTAEYLGHQLAA